MRRLAEPGQWISGKYQIERLLGRGAMADVYAAQDSESGERIALKLLRAKADPDSEMLGRLQREVLAQQLVKHRNVAALYDCGYSEQGYPFVVVEMLRGRSLRDRIVEEKTIAPQFALSYTWQTLQGLRATHAAGVIHRDLKPANLMLEPSPGPVERVVLIDFGFATHEGARKLTAMGHVVGSLSYLAPERLAGSSSSPQSDLYALGIIFYEMLAGSRPFVADTDAVLIQQHMQEAPPPLRSFNPQLQIPGKLEEIIFACLEKSPAKRPASAAMMAEDLEAAATLL